MSATPAPAPTKKGYPVFTSRKQLQQELTKTQAQLRQVHQYIALHITDGFDNPIYERAYRNALRELSQVLLTGSTRPRYVPRATQARQSSIAHRAKTAADADDPPFV